MDKFPSHITYHSRSCSWLCTGSWIRCHTGNDLPVVMLHRCKTSTRAKLKITEIVIHTSRWEENILQTNFADNKNIMLTIQNIDKWEEKKNSVSYNITTQKYHGLFWLVVFGGWWAWQQERAQQSSWWRKHVAEAVHTGGWMRGSRPELEASTSLQRSTPSTSASQSP